MAPTIIDNRAVSGGSSGYVDDGLADAQAVRDLQASAQTNVAAVQGQINDASQSLSGFTANLQSINSQISVATALLESLLQQRSGLQSQRGGSGLSDDQKRDLDSKLQSLGQRIDFVQQQVSDLQGQAADINKQIAAQQGKIDDLNTNGLQRAQGLDRDAQVAADSRRQADDAHKTQDSDVQQLAVERQRRQAVNPLDIDYQGEPGVDGRNRQR